MKKVTLDLDLVGFATSKQWYKDLTGFIQLSDGRSLNDKQVRTVVEKGIRRGYRLLSEISDEIAIEWLTPKANEQSLWN